MIAKQAIKPIIISLALLSSCTAGAASFIPPSTDSDYNYVGFRAGGVLPMNTRGNTDLQRVSTNSTYIAGMSIGRKFNDRFAIEIEYMNRGESDINSSAKTNASAASNSWGVSSNSLMLNFAADLMAKDLATPYVKFGIGVSRNYANTCMK
jgi:opacity protein-like surface antigen